MSLCLFVHYIVKSLERHILSSSTALSWGKFSPAPKTSATRTPFPSMQAASATRVSLDHQCHGWPRSPQPVTSPFQIDTQPSLGDWCSYGLFLLKWVDFCLGSYVNPDLTTAPSPVFTKGKNSYSYNMLTSRLFCRTMEVLDEVSGNIYIHRRDCKLFKALLDHPILLKFLWPPDRGVPVLKQTDLTSHTSCPPPLPTPLHSPTTPLLQSSKQLAVLTFGTEASTHSLVPPPQAETQAWGFHPSEQPKALSKTKTDCSFLGGRPVEKTDVLFRLRKCLGYTFNQYISSTLLSLLPFVHTLLIKKGFIMTSSVPASLHSCAGWKIFK